MNVFNIGKFENCFCAFCKHERKVHSKKHISTVNIVLSGLLSLVVGFLLFKELSPKIMVLFVMFMAVSEMFIQVRWRIFINCPHCGFDPILYLKDPQAAASKVKESIKIKQSQPEYLISAKNPLKNLPVKKISKDKPVSVGLSKRL